MPRTPWMIVLCVALLLMLADPRIGHAQTPVQTWAPAADPTLRPPPIVREFRAAWVATVANIDWPSAPGLPVETLRAEMRTILDTASRLHLNALIFQVRPACDAMYPSALEPWSEFLTGQSGSPPGSSPTSGSPTTYDPLAEWVAESHARGIELHAWFNPFRARHFQSKRPDAPTHISKSRPDLVRSYDNYLWLDPGEPDAQEHSLRVVLDVVTRYDIDGVHIDDYFYPYPKGSIRFPDESSYAKYLAVLQSSTPGTPPLALDDWRRDNINRFVRRLAQETHRLKPFVKVGISPFGIWRPGSPPGIAGFDPYDKLAADARLWIREGVVDYVAPQLYWPIDQKAQSYTRLLDWWIANNDRVRHIWVGNNASRVLPAPDPAAPTTSKPEKSWEPAEILQQIAATRATNLGPGGASGNILFSMVALTQNRRGLADALLNGPYAEPSLVPASPWLAIKPDGSPLPPPVAPTITSVTIQNDQVVIAIAPVSPDAKHVLVQGRYGSAWRWVAVPPSQPELPLAQTTRDGPLNAVSVSILDAAGRESDAAIWHITR